MHKPNVWMDIYKRWRVSYPGKRYATFEHWWVAVQFAIYVCRHPHVMQDLEK